MWVIKWSYRRIVRKLDLSIEQLKELKGRLTIDNICNGPFVKGNKMCPNTTAIAVKLGKKLTDATVARDYLNHAGITNWELYTFYFFFDIPAMISRKFFESALEAMQSVITDLIQEKLVRTRNMSNVE